MNVLILDDEFFIRENIHYEIDWVALGVNTVIESDRGEDAINLCKNNEIDILISDIRMPGMNGIEVVQKMREYRPSLRVVFISGYPEKEYLKEAITLKAVSFIEKPIDMEMLRSVLEQAIQEIRTERLLHRNVERASVVNARDERIGLATDIVDVNADMETAAAKARSLGFGSDSHLYVTCVATLTASGSFQERELIDYLYESSRCYEDLQILTAFRNHSLIIHFAGAYTSTPALFLRKVIDFIDLHVLHYLGKEQPQIRVGISTACSHFDDLRSSAYLQACAANQKAFYLPSEQYCNYEQPKESTPFPGTETALNELEDTLFSQGAEAFSASLQKSYRNISAQNDMPVSTALSFYCSLAEALWTYNQNHHLHAFEDYKDKYALFETLQRMPFLRNIQDYLLDVAAAMTTSRNQYSYGNDLVDAAVQYISRHFGEPTLSVNDISDSLHIAPGYAERLFKKHTGDTINHFINAYRIDAAKSLLTMTQTPIGDIAAETGFRDSGYFAKVFTKHTGFSPTDYRRVRS